MEKRYLITTTVKIDVYADNLSEAKENLCKNLKKIGLYVENIDGIEISEDYEYEN